jgi:hypothetical protein
MKKTLLSVLAAIAACAFSIAATPLAAAKDFAHVCSPIAKGFSQWAFEPLALRLERFMFKAGYALGVAAFDQSAIDSTGVFFQTELTRVDPVLNQPLADFTWSRDVDIGPLDIGDEVTAFDVMKFTAVGGVQPGGKSFISGKTTEIGNVGLDTERKTSPTFVWAEAIQKTVIELAQAAKLGRNLDSSLLDALNMKKNVDLQNQVYTGDTLHAVRGLVNQTIVTTSNVSAGVGGLLWTQKTDDEILKDINDLLTANWTATGYTVMPRRLGLPPAKFAYLVSRKIANGSMSIAKYLSENSIAMNTNGVPLELVPMRELVGAGAGATDRMISYTKRKDYLRIPLSSVQSTPMQYKDLYQRVVYYCRVGVVELVKPETLRYADGF